MSAGTEKKHFFFYSSRFSIVFFKFKKPTTNDDDTPPITSTVGAYLFTVVFYFLSGVITLFQNGRGSKNTVHIMVNERV